MTWRVFMACVIAAFSALGPALAQDTAQGPDAISRLRFLTGTWNCTGALPNGTSYTATRTYSFPTSGPWMEERTTSTLESKTTSEVQFWGYDQKAGRLVAYDFLPDRVMTKHVQGWRNGNFLATNDDPAYTVVLNGNSSSMKWVTGYADGSNIVESCKR